MDYVFLVKNKAVGPIELHVMTNSIGVVCGVRRAGTGGDGVAFIEDLLRYGCLPCWCLTYQILCFSRSLKCQPQKSDGNYGI